MTRSRKVWLAIIGAAASAVIAGCGSASTAGGGGGGGGGSAHPSTITIGATLPLTGSGAPFGQLFLDALKIAAAQINSTGGVNGAKINVVALDDQALAAPAVMGATQLINKNGALVIATAYNDPPLAQYKLGERYGVPIVNGGGNDPAMLNKPYLWTDSSILTYEAKPAFEYAKAHGIKKIGILAATNYTNYDINVYHQLANSIFGGNQPLVTFDPNSTNVTTQLQQLQSAGVDAISPLSSGTLTLTVAKDMSQLGMHQQVVGTGATLTEPPTIVSEPAWNHALAAVIAEPAPPWLAQAVQAHEHTAPNAYHVFFANVAYIVADAVKALEQQHKTVNGKNLNALFEQYASQQKPFQGVNGPVMFQSSHIVLHPYTISENVNGTFKTLQTVAPGQ